MNWLVELIMSEKEFPQMPAVKTAIKDDLLPDFKEARYADEYYGIEQTNGTLFKVAQELVAYSIVRFNIKPVVTCVLRTQQEQDYIYRNDPSYIKPDGKKKVSPHQLGHAVDFRSIDPITEKPIYSDIQLKELELYINQRYNEYNYYSYTVEHHAVIDGAPHIHLQYCLK